MTVLALGLKSRSDSGTCTEGGWGAGEGKEGGGRGGERKEVGEGRERWEELEEGGGGREGEEGRDGKSCTVHVTSLAHTNNWHVHTLAYQRRGHD